MIITKNFVVINFPKTGSTFVRKSIKKALMNENTLLQLQHKLKLKKRPYYNVHMAENIRDNTFRRGSFDEHGLCLQIPKIHKSKKIISVKRDIFERYVSLYEYGDWKKAPWMSESLIKKKYPKYPELEFKDYIKLLMENNPWENHPNIKTKLMVGPATTQFILFYFKKPFKVLRELNQEYLCSNKYKQDMFNVSFLNQKNLNIELYNFLVHNGYDKAKVEFIINAKKENVSKPFNKSYGEYFDDELITYIKKKESFLFNIFGEYTV